MRARCVVIGVCTFRRPSLKRTLASLVAQDVPAEVEVFIVVADNDELPSARNLVEEFSRNAQRPITYLHCPARNISLARNGILDKAEAAGADALAYLDDDEWVGPDWLAQLLAAMDATGADAVFGPVYGVYSTEVPGWIRAARFHDMDPEIDSAGQVRTGHSGNALISLRSAAFAGRRFDLALGRSGGEDTVFFAEAKRAGALLCPAMRAVAQEDVPPDRAQAGWLMRRRYRMGQTHGLLIGRGMSPVRRAGLVAVAASKVAACLAMALPMAYSTERWSRALLRGCLHVGTLSSLLGLRSLTLYGDEEKAAGRGTPSVPPDRSSH
jgi:succinoglycan biosynthesis protein ExoM